MDVQATVVLKGGTLTSSRDADAGEESTVACDTEISAAPVEGVGTRLSPEGAELPSGALVCRFGFAKA